MPFNKLSLGNARKHYIDTEFFKVIDTEEKAYWLGFISADGCIDIHDNTFRFSIGLSPVDRNHLVKFLRDTNSNYNIYDYARTCSIVITSKRFCENLMSLGIVPRKSMILSPCDCVPDNLLCHYWRGFVDGDGTICGGGRKEISLCGTYEICFEFLSWVKRSGVNTNSKVTSRNNTLFFSKIGGKFLAGKLASLLYKNSKVSLDRKYEKAKGIML